jgi:hypothetical protein
LHAAVQTAVPVTKTDNATSSSFGVKKLIVSSLRPGRFVYPATRFHHYLAFSSEITSFPGEPYLSNGLSTERSFFSVSDIPTPSGMLLRVNFLSSAYVISVGITVSCLIRLNGDCLDLDVVR